MRTESHRIERDGWATDGVLTVPVAEGFQPPVVVLVHGSGPISRQGAFTGSLGIDFGETVEVYRSFAEQLAGRGVATLRYDKRSCFAEAETRCTARFAEYPGDVNRITVDDFVEDARAAIRSLGGHAELSDVIVAGHSQGGTFVPHLVASEPRVEAGIGLGASGLPLATTLAGQLGVLADHLEAVDAERYAPDIAELRATAVRYETELAQVLDGTWPEPTWLGGSPAFWRSFADWADRPWSDFEAVAAIGAPLLYVAGDLDFNVWPAHLARYASEGAEVTGLDLTTELVPGLTHAFVPVVSGVVPVDHEVDPRFSPEVVDLIVDWLARDVYSDR
ncbi:MAG: alpha/beta hydrolase [Myxococcota bacterium]